MSTMEHPPVGPILVYWECLLELVADVANPACRERVAAARDASPELVHAVLADYGMKAANYVDRHSWDHSNAARDEIELIEGLERHFERCGAHHLAWIGVWYPDGKLMERR